MVALTLINSVYVLFGFKIVQLVLFMDISNKLILKTHSKRSFDALYLCMTLTTHFQYKLGLNNEMVKSRLYIYFAD